MAKRKTAGELSLKAASDNAVYDPHEVADALSADVIEQLQICGAKHAPIFDEEEYCVVLVVAGDPLISGVRRHKYYSYLYLPSPRPNQSVFLYNKKTAHLKHLWSLPNAKVMAIVSEMPTVDKKWQRTKNWCDSFFDGSFWHTIRDMHKITMPSETEYLNANREKLIQAGCKVPQTRFTDPFDFSKVSINKIVDTKTASAE